MPQPAGVACTVAPCAVLQQMPAHLPCMHPRPTPGPGWQGLGCIARPTHAPGAPPMPACWCQLNRQHIWRGKGRTAWPPMMMDQSRASFSRRRCTELYARGAPAPPPPPPPPLMPATTRSASARTSGANISVRATSRTRGRLLRAGHPSSGSGMSSRSRRAAGERPSAKGCRLQCVSTAWSASERAAGL
jgi:hypothetical protein